MDSVIDRITRDGVYLDRGFINEVDEIQELVSCGLIIRVSDIPHHPKTLNPSYTYVINDEKGKGMAVDRPLFTMVLSM